MRRLLKTALILSIFTTMFLGPAGPVSAEEIRGESCLTGTQNDSLETGKEISYALAVREALVNSEAYRSLTREIKACPLRKSILEAAAGCAVTDVRVTRAEIAGKRICTEITAVLDAERLSQIVRRKTSEWERARGPDFEGLMSNDAVRILNYKKKGAFVSVLYQAKRFLEMESVDISLVCYDENGARIRTVSGTFPLRPLMAGESRWGSLPLPPGTATFDLVLGSSGS
ncbi:MAG: hypothetical protein JRJ35_06325 [Deltaproteobacteria bacterium]|nr:hypothetical protein [Deltaproteobacteria bacterium]MBW1949764.1 hypothetical protein [Deltaproteobacteria bacterium]MBW2009649.1 hypothetical protein [Deltaproteobacteria bacterium]